MGAGSGSMSVQALGELTRQRNALASTAAWVSEDCAQMCPTKTLGESGHLYFHWVIALSRVPMLKVATCSQMKTASSD